MLKITLKKTLVPSGLVLYFLSTTLAFCNEIETNLYQEAFDTPKNLESAKTIEELTNGFFGIKAYHANYVVISQLDTVPEGDILQEKTNYIKTETKFQLSLKADFTTDWFNSKQIWTGAYTQRSYWQLFVSSEPFRETNYMPEAFVTIPLNHKLDPYGLKAISFGFIHQSNGQKEFSDPNDIFDDPSRSWNRLYTKGSFQWDSLLADLTIWYPIESTGSTNDNADIVDYYGYGLLELNYAYEKLLTTLTTRYNFATNKGAAEVSLSYPVSDSKKVFYYLQGFTGYGQSLIDYHTNINQIGFGISFSR